MDIIGNNVHFPLLTEHGEFIVQVNPVMKTGILDVIEMLLVNANGELEKNWQATIYGLVQAEGVLGMPPFSPVPDRVKIVFKKKDDCNTFVFKQASEKRKTSAPAEFAAAVHEAFWGQFSAQFTAPGEAYELHRLLLRIELSRRFRRMTTLEQIIQDMDKIGE